jgi:hypothetical protein
MFKEKETKHNKTLLFNDFKIPFPPNSFFWITIFNHQTATEGTLQNH